MNRNLCFLIFLLTVISVINAVPNELAKRKLLFEKCPVVPGEQVTPVVTVSPDHIHAGQVVDFSISGVDADLLSKVTVAFFDLHGIPVDFPSIFLANVDKPITVKAPLLLPESYAVVVGITDLSPAPKLRIYCAVATVGASKVSLSLDFIDQVLGNHTINNPLLPGHIN